MTTEGIRVLVAEDDPLTRGAYQELLSRWGFQTRAAEDGLKALREIRMERPHILLSDLEMPIMNGYELLSIVRRMYPQIRAVAMSGSYSGEIVPPGVSAEAFYAKGTGQFLRLRTILRECSRLASIKGRQTADLRAIHLA